MRVLLRDRLTGRYVAGGGTAAVSRQEAHDFTSVPSATRFALDSAMSSVEIVLSYDQPDCEIPLPLLAEWCRLDGGRRRAARQA